jgi:hypothetical protein
MTVFKKTLLLFALFEHVFTQVFDGVLNRKVLELWFDGLDTIPVLSLTDRRINKIQNNSFDEMYQLQELHLGYWI